MTAQDGTDVIWEAILRYEGMLETMINVHSIKISSVDLISIIRIDPENVHQQI